MAEQRQRSRDAAGAQGGGAAQPPPAGAADPEVRLAGRPATRARHVGQAARRPGQGHRPREVHLRHQSSRHALRPHRPLAASARARRLGRSDGGAARARRQGGAGRGGSRPTRRTTGDVPGRRGRGRRRRHRRARDRRGAAGQGRVRGAAARDRRRAGARRRRRRRCSPSGNVRQGQTQETGDLAAGFKAAAHTIEETYATHVITHVCLESHGTVCEWDGDKLTAWVSTQGINAARENFATGAEHSAGQRPRHLPVHGRRLRQQGAERRRRGPDLRAAREGGQRAGQADARSQGRASRDRQPAVGRGARSKPACRPTACSRRSTPSRGAPAAPARRPASRCRTSIGSPNRRRTHKDVFINTGQQRPMRAPGHPQGSFITEIMMDELADQGEDGSGRVPDQEPAARGAERDVAARICARAPTEFGWDKRHPTGDTTPGPIKTGMGVAICTWGGGGRGPSQAHCEIASDGSVVMRLGTQDLGTGTRTLVAMVTADSLGLPGVASHSRRSATRCTASARCRAAARRRRASARRFASPRSRRSTR